MKATRCRMLCSTADSTLTGTEALPAVLDASASSCKKVPLDRRMPTCYSLTKEQRLGRLDGHLWRWISVTHLVGCREQQVGEPHAVAGVAVHRAGSQGDRLQLGHSVAPLGCRHICCGHCQAAPHCQVPECSNT